MRQRSRLHPALARFNWRSTLAIHPRPRHHFEVPFTLAHPAAVLPLNRVRPSTFLLAPLVIGSMAPDFAYFLTQSQASSFGHTPLGLITFCAPVGLFALWLYHLALKPALLRFVPEADRISALPVSTFRFAPWPNTIGYIALILLGALSHVFWDAFTHESGAFVVRTPALRTVAFSAFGVNVPIFKLLQHGSTLVGITVLFLAASRVYWSRTGQSLVTLPLRWNSTQHRLSAIIFVTAAGGALAAGVPAAAAKTGTLAVAAFVVRSSVGAMTGAFLALFLLGIRGSHSPHPARAH